jgi:hypothetical protein
MDSENPKNCPFCAEIIPAAAKLCPRCRQWLSLRSFRHPVVIICVGFVFFFGMGFAISTFFARLVNPPPYYDRYLGSIRLVESRMNWVERQKEPSGKENLIYITGIVTNQSPIAWRHVEFECRFFDTNGTMIDAQNSFSYFTLQANDNSAFRVSVAPTAPTNQYASFKIFVSTARNTKGWLY